MKGYYENQRSKTRSRRRRQVRNVEATTPTGDVAVAHFRQDCITPGIVKPRAIIGLWDEYVAERDEENKRLQALRDAREAAREKDLDEKKVTARRAAKYGVVLGTAEAGHVTLTIADMNKLLDLLEGTNAR